MTRANLRQKIFGLSKKDLAALGLTAADAIAAALIEIDPANPQPANYPDAHAAPFVHQGDIVWCVHPARPLRGATTFAYVDDETGKVLQVHRRGHKRGAE